MKKIYFLIVIALFFSRECLAFGNVFGWAWSENIGWISFNCQNQNSCSQSDYGVNIKPDGTLEGYAWSENIGWISFNESHLVDCPIPPCKALFNPSTKKIEGWAKVLAAKDPEAGGWSGWIRLSDTKYGVSINTSTSPLEFEGFAWSDMVGGWISFNCKNQNSCSNSNYKVYTTFNFPPSPPTGLSEDINYCGWALSPQVAPGLVITLSWSYSDPEGDSQSAYEIWLDNDPSFSGPKFNHLVDLSSSNAYTLNLAHDDDGDWLSNLSFGKTYYWKVRVKDSKGNWSDWSEIKSFNTPSHPGPSPYFKFSPQRPMVGEVVQFCSISIGDCSLIINTNEQSKCYNQLGNVVPCSAFSWSFENANPSSSNLQNPTTTFTLISSNKVTLTITDSFGFSCSTSTEIQTTFPPPKWFEIPPVSFLRKNLATLTFYFNLVKIHLTKFFERIKL